ncbi:putative aminophosphonate oxidoreductase [Modicisalibacter xianhensis]|uniref:Putative aminophosphonate oxidoreductase n=1 Tax=Modicisalibacter xianhensis TaxID=442341 RepID=A0A4R8FB47_9GAMM|nr:FAD-binding oxidoreductase [Halomonas xianhensis]TDX22846.1 putative aminophosphonate oxidoreductase [Halomonas xianhensis]
MSTYRGFWYAEALDHDHHVAPMLENDIDADVCIIGGGYLGLWTAIRLKRENAELKVVIVERDLCGAGASGRNGGVATNWWGKFLSVRKLCGHEEALRICKAAESAIDEIGEFCREYGVDAQYRKEGWIWSASSEMQKGSWNTLIESLEEYGVNPFVPLAPGEAQARTGSPRNLEAIFDPNAATVQPAMYARGLRRHALDIGVEIYEQSPMQRLDRARTPTVHTEKGSVKAKKVVIAMNAWGAIFPELRRNIAIVSSDMVATAKAPERLKEIGFTGGEGMTDSRIVLNYYRNTPEGRVIFGKPLGKFGFAGRVGDLYECPTPAVKEVTDAFHEIYPNLSDVPIVSSWTGPIDRAMNGLPTFGHLGGHDNIVYAIGFSGNGVGTTVFASRIVSSLVQDKDDEWSRCGLVETKIKRFPTEPFRYIGGLAVRDALVRKEALEDRNKKAGWLTRQLAALAPAGYVPTKKS